MPALTYLLSFTITFAVKIITAKLLYKKFGAKCNKYFNNSTGIAALVVMCYFIYIHTNKHPMYPVMFGATSGLVCGNNKITSDNKL